MWKDKWTIRAKKEGYVARSVYKLKEANERFKFLRPGIKVVELGASPGSWTQYVLECIGDKGILVAVDIHALQIRLNRKNFVFINEDVFKILPQRILEITGTLVDVLLSDLAPNTTGISFSDHEASYNLAKRALEFASSLVKNNGFFFVKFFEGERSKELIEFAKTFSSPKLFRPKATRKSSSEIYICGTVKG